MNCYLSTSFGSFKGGDFDGEAKHIIGNIFIPVNFMKTVYNKNSYSPF